MTGPLRGVARPRVYFIQSGDSGPIKIGYALNTYSRFHNLQAGNPEQLHYLGDIDGDRDTEQAWHQRFGELHIRGEWHHASVDLLTAISVALIAQKAVDEDALRVMARGAAFAGDTA